MAYGVRSQKFLCCLPVRLGVFVLSFFQLIGYGASAALLWFATFSKDVHLDKMQKITVIIFAVYTSILALLSLCGFVGSIFRSKGLDATYSTALNFLFGVSLALAIFWAVIWFRMSKEKFIEQCVNGSTDQSVIDACNHVNEIRFIALGWVILALLVHLYECIIVARYVRQLREEDDEKWRMKSLKQGGYSNISGRASTEGLTQPTAHYPYSDTSNSFGNKANI